MMTRATVDTELVMKLDMLGLIPTSETGPTMWHFDCTGAILLLLQVDESRSYPVVSIIRYKSTSNQT